jgi:DUF1009 family protein
MSFLSSDSRIGIIAGAGELPLQLIHSCVARSQAFLVIVLLPFADPDRYRPYPHVAIPMGKLSKILENLTKNHVTHVTFAGHVQRLRGKQLLDLDWEGAQLLAKVTKEHLWSDNKVFSVVIDYFEKHHFTVLSTIQVMDELSASAGLLSSSPILTESWADIHYGLHIANAIGQLDVGQAVVVQQGVTLAVEAAEGTDQMLERAAILRLDGLGGVLVKLKKTNQESRIDLPTIGSNTIHAMARSGLSGIVIEADNTLVLSPAEVKECLNHYGLFGIAIRRDDFHLSPFDLQKIYGG